VAGPSGEAHLTLMNTHTLPPRDEMLTAFLNRDGAYEGVFVTGVRTTGIFCRTTCSARKPKPENVEFFPSTRDALLAGYRPCLRCRPMVRPGEVPSWLEGVMSAVEGDPGRRWRDADLTALGADPTRVRRWFQAHHGMTFHAYTRALRLGAALGRIQEGDTVSRAAFDSGYESLSGFSEALRKLAGAPPTRLDGAPLLQVTRIPTPLGPVIAAADAERLYLLEFADRRMLPTQLRKLGKLLGCVYVPGTNEVLRALHEELDEYFAGRRAGFTVPLASPGTPFQETVWDALRAIPPGETRSYLEMARIIGRPTAVRAVARANGQNRLAIVIPCHRVVAADGSLSGYGGGVWRKKKLLEIEEGGAGY